VSDDGQKLVLVADDDQDILDLVTFRLEHSGYEVMVAHDGQEAIDQALARTPDLCVLDVMMPGVDGYEATRRLRAEESTRSVPIILLTARAQEADVERGFEAGANDYVTKPFSPQELRARVQALLSRQ
jgi:DNA-binding response OmpR family regulator